MPQSEAIAYTSTAYRLHAFTPTQGKHIANAVLHALRRGPTRCTQGKSQRFQVLGASSIPNGLPPLVHASWHIGRAGSHEGLDLPEVGVLITDTTLRDAITQARIGAFDDLVRIVYNQKRVQTLFLIREHPRSGWYAVRNPAIGRAGDAALKILDVAHQAGHVTAHPKESLWPR